ncbi:MAG: 50S ribosomal protein L3 [candidate division WOR-3 bacterium]
MSNVEQRAESGPAPTCALLGRKGAMSQLFDEQGRAVPVTAIEVGTDCVLVRRRTKDADGYDALQLGFGKANKKRLTKPRAGVFKRAGVLPVRLLREVRLGEAEASACAGLKPGQHLTVDAFKPGEIVHVVGRTRGRGFAGGVERWNWSSGPRSHGSMSHRRTGSVGAGSSPGRVLRGRHLPGHYGNEQVTVKNLRVVKVESGLGRLFVTGAIPGPRGGVVIVRKKS